MTNWAPKRFWTQATTDAADGGFTVQLDGRAVRTPAKTLLVVPTQPLAHAIAREWDAQEKQVDPTTMPLTRMANSALDKVTPQQDAVADMLAEYGGSDLICYRADYPAGLVERQKTAWDPWLAWAANVLDAPLVTQSGVMPVAQPNGSLVRLRAALQGYSAFELAAVHDLITITGSMVLGLATAHGKLDASEAWRLSRVDEDWQIAEWGEDEEAAELAARKRDDLALADRFLRLCQD